jgi:hypothetical protein
VKYPSQRAAAESAVSGLTGVRAAWRGHAVMAVVDQIEITG